MSNLPLFFRHFKKPYIRKYEKIGDFKVWIVDGSWIRKNIDEDFVNYDQPLCKKYIPKNEFWIDVNNDTKEIRYYIEHLLIENRLMNSGVKYKKAFKIAAEKEKSERKKSEEFLKVKNLPKEELLKRIRCNCIMQSDNLKIWTVKGTLVRSLFLQNYAEGGHDKVYSFVPSGEVWIDCSLKPKERKFIILHELRERRLMSKGKTYLPAHRRATKIEDYYRHHPKKLEKAIKIELKKNK